MAIAFHSAGSFSGTSANLTPACTISNGDTVVVFVHLNPSTLSVSGISGGGTYSRLTSLSDGTVKTEVWATSAGGGTTSAGPTVTITGTATDWCAQAASYSGVVAIGNTNTASGTASNPSIGLTTQDANNVAVGSFGANDGNAATAGAGTTLRVDDADTVMAAATGDVFAASAGAQTVRFNHSVTGGHWTAGAVELRSTSGGGATAWGAQMNHTWCRIVQA